VHLCRSHHMGDAFNIPPGYGGYDLDGTLFFRRALLGSSFSLVEGALPSLQETGSIPYLQVRGGLSLTLCTPRW